MLCKNEQSGRSMIEMLGVLAIIGVLSVGGIAGYSKAMSKYKFSKAQDQLLTLLINIRSAFAGASTYDGLNNTSAIDLNIIPADMLPGGLAHASGRIVHTYAGEVTIDNENDGKYFTVKFDSLSTETCANLASVEWDAEGMVKMSINEQDFTRSQFPIALMTALNQCNLPESGNSITWVYY